jgi:hypothetical protein
MNKYDAVAFIFAAMSTATAVSWMAWAWAKTRTTARPPLEISRVEERLARIENAVEAIAVEVERVSESQRFTTKLLAERAADEAPMRAGRFDAR